MPGRVDLIGSFFVPPFFLHSKNPFVVKCVYQWKEKRSWRPSLINSGFNKNYYLFDF